MGHILKVRYNKWPPWAMNSPSHNGTVLIGVLKDVFDAPSYSLEYKFNIEYQTDQVFGSLLPDGTYSGMLGALARKDVDMAGPFCASEQRAAVADFTNCLEFSSLGIITGIQSANRNMFLYFKVFTWQVWLCLLAAMLTCAFVCVLISKVAVIPGRPPKVLLLLFRYCWIFGSYLIGREAGSVKHRAVREVWVRYSFRLLLTAWLLGPVLNFLYTFQGSITSTFAVEKLLPVVSDLEELSKNEKVVPVTTKGSAVEICFKMSHEYSHLWDRMQNNSIRFSAETVERTLPKVERGTHVLIVDYVHALSIAADWVKSKGRCSVQVEEILFCQNFISLALRKGFDPVMKKQIDVELTYIIQAKLADRWLNRVLNNYTHCTRMPPERSKPLSTSDVMGGLAMWAAGIALALVTFAAEVLAGCNTQGKSTSLYETKTLTASNSLK